MRLREAPCGRGVPAMTDVFDWRPNVPIAEDAYAAPAPMPDLRTAAALRSEAMEARREGRDAAPLWKAYHARRSLEEQARDVARGANAVHAAAFGARIGKIRGVVFDVAEVDDFGGIELQIVIDGKRWWTRPVKVSEVETGYRRLRDAISALRRKDRMAYNWLDYEAVWRRRVEWYGYEQVEFGVNEYGTRKWPR